MFSFDVVGYLSFSQASFLEGVALQGDGTLEKVDQLVGERIIAWFGGINRGSVTRQLMVFLETFLWIWVNYNDLTVLLSPGIMVSTGNHPQMGLNSG